MVIVALSRYAPVGEERATATFTCELFWMYTVLNGEARDVTTEGVIVAVGAVLGTETVVVYSLYATTVFPLYAVCFTVPVPDFAVGMRGAKVLVAHVVETLVAVVLVAKVAVVPLNVPVIV